MNRIEMNEFYHLRLIWNHQRVYRLYYFDGLNVNHWYDLDQTMERKGEDNMD